MGKHESRRSPEGFVAAKLSASHLARLGTQEARCDGAQSLWLAGGLFDEEILKRLLALNLERAARQAIRVGGE